MADTKKLILEIEVTIEIEDSTNRLFSDMQEAIEVTIEKELKTYEKYTPWVKEAKIRRSNYEVPTL
jgi:hypothetical protein